MRALLIVLALTAGCIRPISEQVTAGVVEALAPPKSPEEKAQAAATPAEDTPLGRLGEAVSTAMVAELSRHKAELRAFVADLASTAGRAAAEESQKILHASLAQDLERGGPISRAIATGTAQAVREAFAVGTQELRSAFPDCPPGSTLRECARQDAMAIARDAADVMLAELRMPLRLFIGGLILLVFGLCLVTGVFLVRLIRAPRGGAIARAPGSRWPHHRPLRHI
jgi:Na+-transporting methylmalonyl-CoA/oxaloacetate decarboxylase gamma subunit